MGHRWYACPLPAIFLEPVTPMPVRMKDIAAELGVSVMTVSKALRNEGRISTATRDRVLQKIKELNYQPNLLARSLVSGRSFLIGLIVPDLMHPFFAALAKFLSGHLRAQGYAVAISSSEESAEIERHEIATFLARGVDALVLASTQRSANAAIFKRIEEQGVPYVLADRMIPGLKAHFIGSDDRAIGLIATEHLIERGYRRIAHIQRPGISTGASRLQGYKAALKRHRRASPSELIATAASADAHGEQCGFEAMQRLLALKRRPDAVFCYNDVIAYGALKAILEAGLRVPSDVGLVGVANLASLTFWDASPIAVTTVDQGIGTLAELTSQLLLRLVQKQDRVAPQRILLPPKLIVRSTS
jgi:LacI family transcriptional regulator